MRFTIKHLLILTFICAMLSTLIANVKTTIYCGDFPYSLGTYVSKDETMICQFGSKNGAKCLLVKIYWQETLLFKNKIKIKEWPHISEPLPNPEYWNKCNYEL